MAVTMPRRHSGHTVTEMLTTLAIIGLIFAAGPRLLDVVQKVLLQTAARAEIQRDLRISLEQIERELWNASAASVTISQDAGEPPYSMISFSYPDGRSAGFKQSGRKLLRLSGSGSTVLAQNVEYLAFTYPRTDDNTVISVAVSLGRSTYSGRWAALEATTAKVRLMNP